MKSLRNLLLILSAVLFLSASANANTYYVATTGSNNNPGSSSQPWGTLQHAVNTIAPGDTIIVRAGTYAGCRIEQSGGAGAVCTLKAEDGAAVLINAPSPSNRHQSNIEVENFDAVVSHWVIDGFEVASAPRYGIDLRFTDHITVQNCYVHGSVVTGIFLAFGYYPLIENNESASNGEHGIYQSNSGDYPTIRGNNLHHNFRAGVHLNGDRNFTPGDGIISFAVVEKNIIWENGTGGGSAINCDGVSDSLIRNNLLYNNRASGVSLYAQDGAEGSSRNRVYNNTIVMPSNGRWCVNIMAATEGQPDPVGNKVKNNILYNAHSFRGSVSTYTTADPTFESNYNAVVNRFSTNGGANNMPLSQWRTNGYDTNSLVATPSELFTDPANNNYHLKSNSPAANAGTTLTDVTDDLEGVSRPQGAAYDVGCFETPQCGFTLSPASLAFTRTGGAGNVNVTAPAGCNWTAESNDGFITITEGGSGTGSGSVTFQVAANTGASVRSGTLTIAGQTFTVYQAVDFNDVPASHLFYMEISKVYARGITIGCGSGNYCPDQVVTREQMAAFILRALGEFNPPQPAMQRFTDVPPANPFYSFIERMAVLNITQGCGGGNYCPGQAVTREQMAAFMIRALGEFNPPQPAMQRFADVPPASPFYNFIDRMAVLGVTQGCGGGNYCPTLSVTRGQMAAFLVRAFNL
jgi:parallel beta-helix repeat protein